MADYAKGGYIPPEWTRNLARYLAIYGGCTIRRTAVVAAQHTYSPQCDGLHEPGPCPSEQKG
jgi:hypothetical protein